MCIMQECLAYFRGLTGAQQLKAASIFKTRVNPATYNPSALAVLTKIMADVQFRSSTSTTPHGSPPAPATSKGRIAAQRFVAHSIFLDNLSAVDSSPVSRILK